jgi:exopolyphosphatase/guanosine-5'-triphosphate,3'-diphosphate pyrophosphatase
MNPLAVLDLGTNTFQLLIAERTETGFRIVHDESTAAKIGRGGISQGLLTPEAFERAERALLHLRGATDRHGIAPEAIQAFATSAVRNARNGTEFVEAMRAATGIRIQVIDGDQEAGLIFDGVRLGTELGTDPALVMDIGGGSVEFILGSRERIFWKRSFEIGGQRLMDRFMRTDPISLPSVRQLDEYLSEQLLPLTNAIHQYAPTVLIGSAGSFETLNDLHWMRTHGYLPGPDRASFELPLDSFYQSYELLLTHDRAGRLALPGMIELRVDMIIVGSCLIAHVLRAYGIPRMQVSTYALKEGVLARSLTDLTHAG